jgi:hypothetical protein
MLPESVLFSPMQVSTEVKDGMPTDNNTNKCSDSGEGFAVVDGNYGDRLNLTLWQGADAVVANVSATCNNTVLVIHSVGPVLIDQYKENPNITAILWAGLPGKLRQPLQYALTNTPQAKCPVMR